MTANIYKMNSARRRLKPITWTNCCRNLSSQVKDLQGRLDESEAARAGAGKRQIANLELRVSCSSEMFDIHFIMVSSEVFSEEVFSIGCFHPNITFPYGTVLFLKNSK